MLKHTHNMSTSYHIVSPKHVLYREGVEALNLKLNCVGARSIDVGFTASQPPTGLEDRLVDAI